ncbi:oxidoreductase [Thermaerobacillus caldiproteolyticus]|uniref:NAD(P)-dependent dehydrogenase (Short-subunit alcohol dehydrogenase family) n=1 Tax=Thermaerobacillus caldiproteolyticus TaxID=247480 RepID=A0A7W0BZW7_9BACL|nr:oxidoreductase [Anoxybacillus caldiproteolyticus]MBA2876488.1 NAD(P)-dependent dehydrogenase (short-subunit alcohol dehydrogenase family) [Anoxybacillus caldiproteolyticus]
MNQTFDKQPVAFVTGASSGFGLLTSVALASEGYRVLASMRDLDNKGRLEAAAKEAGVTDRIEIIQLDVTDFSAAEAVIQDVIHRYGRIDLLVNNAGYAAGGFTEELAVEEWRRQFETNFFGLVAVTKAVLPSMRKRRSGKIVNISSISGRIGFPSMGPYVASKFAVEGFSESLRMEMLPYGVHVVLIEPGSYKTDIWSKGMGAVTINPNSPYVKEMKEILKYVNQVADTAPAPDEVIQQIVQVAKSPYPKLRYPVGKGVKLGIVLKNVLPWKWWERIVTKRFWKGS